jgi:5-methylcytosine-specific restriction endonuclease McrA
MSVRDFILDKNSPLLEPKPTKKSKRRKSCPKAVKQSVWLKYFGEKMIGKCYVCKRSISYMNFEVGHNKPVAKGGKSKINNVRPICRTCNRSMGTIAIEDFKKKYFSKKIARKKARKRKRKRESKSISNPLLTTPNPLLATPNPLQTTLNLITFGWSTVSTAVSQPPIHCRLL